MKNKLMSGTIGGVPNSGAWAHLALNLLDPKITTPSLRRLFQPGRFPLVLIRESEEDLDDALPHRGKLGVVAQTTHTPEHVAEMIAAIARRPFRELKIVNTLCLEVVRRQEAAVELSADVDVMFVLGGLHSANTREMAHLCEDTGTPTYHLETWDQFAPEMAAGRTVAGVTAGASTPEWVIADFVKHLEALDPAVPRPSAAEKTQTPP